MDVSLTNEMKGYGAPVTHAVENEDKVKPQVAPVQADTGASSASLNDQALHGDKGESKGKGEKKKMMEMSLEEQQKVLEEVQSRLESIGSNLSLGLAEDEKTKSIVAQIRERESGEVIRQFPSEELLKLKAKLNDLVGLIFDSKA